MPERHRPPSRLPPLLAPAALTLAAGFAAMHRPWLDGVVQPAFGTAAADGVAALFGAVAWLAAAWLGSRLLDLAVDGGRRAVPVPRLLSDLLRALIYGLALLAILAWVLRLPVAGLVATSGVVIAVLGFALRNMIADIFSGIALNVEHPYRIGDWIELGPGLTGRVDEINWRATRLITADGTAVVVPNGMAAGSRFVNYSRPGSGFRASLPVLLDADVPVARAKRVLLSALVCADGVLAEPRPDVLVDGVTPSGVSYLARFWVRDYAQLAATRDAVGTAVLDHLTRAGLTPAQPKQEVRRPRAQAGEAAPAALLRRADLFAAFHDAEVAELAAALHRHDLPAGAAAVHQGDQGDSLFLVGEGALDVRMALDGRTLLLDRMRPGDVFGEMSLLTGQPRSASVVAHTDAVVYELCKDALDPVLRRRPELAARLAELMARRQRRNDARRQAVPAATAAADVPPDLLARLLAFFKL